MKVNWISVADKLPVIQQFSDLTTCGASAAVLTVVENCLGSEMEVQILYRGGRGDCSELYWSGDYPKTNHWAELPEFPE